MVGEDSLDLSLVQSGQSLGEIVNGRVGRSKDGQPGSGLERLEETGTRDDTGQAGQELGSGLSQGRGQAQDLVDDVDLEVGGGSVGAGVDVAGSLLDDDSRARGGVALVASVKDDGDGEVAVEHHVVVQRPDDGVGRTLGNVHGSDRSVEDVQAQDVGEQGRVTRDLGGNGGKGLVARGYVVVERVNFEVEIEVSPGVDTHQARSCCFPATGPRERHPRSSWRHSERHQPTRSSWQRSERR